MNTKSRLLCTAVLLGPFLAAFKPASAQLIASSYSGDAIALQAKVLNLATLTVASTGALPSTGGSLSASTVSLSTSLGSGTLFSGIDLNTGLLQASTTGGNNRASSSASVDNLNLGIDLAGLQTLDITADVIEGDTLVTTSGVSGSSTITNLKVGGNSIVVTGAANQTVSLLGVGNLSLGTLTLNEQINTSTLNHPELTVNALDLQLLPNVLGGANVTLGHATSDLTSAPMTTPEPGSFAVVISVGVSGAGFLLHRKRRR